MALPRLDLDIPQESYSFDDGDAVLRAKLSSGPSRTRLDMLDAPIEGDVTLVLTPPEFQYWRAFFRQTIARGAFPFIAGLVVDTADVEDHTVRIVPGSMRTNISGTAHIVSMRWEIELSDDPADAASLTMLHDLYGDDAEQVLDDLSQLVNFDLAIIAL